MRANHRWLWLSLAALCACSRNEPAGPQAASASASAANAPRSGGEAIVLLGSDFAGSWPSGLDPATNVTGGANLSLMNAIYGGLVRLTSAPDGSDPRVVGDLAAGFEVAADGRTVTFHLRPGVKFSDGTPFNSAAVKFSIERSLDSLCSCTPQGWPWDKSNRVSAPDELTVVLHFSSALAPIMNAFPATNLNWIVSPSAVAALGADRFKITPVGAGPFRVVSDQLSSKLVLERNPLYWQKSHPYLDRLTFQSIGSEQAAYQALAAGDANAYEGMSSPLLIEQTKANAQLTATLQPPTSPLVVQLNTVAPPFNDLRAREAVYYATDAQAIRRGLFKSWFPVSQSFTASGGLFHRETIPGYRTYDLERARALVKDLGGLRVTLGTLRAPVSEATITALQTQWAQAGITATIETYDLGTLITKFQSHTWQAMLQTAGSFDPEAGPGLGFRFRSNSIFSGVQDPELNRLMDQGLATLDAKQRDQDYLQIAQYLSEHAYAPFLVAPSGAQVTRGLYGPGLTTKIPPILVTTSVPWQDAWLAAR